MHMQDITTKNVMNRSILFPVRNQLIVKKIVLVPRIDGYFWFEGRQIRARKRGTGIGVALLLEHSPVDDDFDENVLFLSESQRQEIISKFTESDDLTLLVIGHDWNYGVRPIKKKLTDEEKLGLMKQLLSIMLE